MRLIYALIDPRTALVRYIGQSSRGMSRPRAHRGVIRGNTKHDTWLKSLRSRGLDFEIAVLESDCADLNASEQWWIAYGRALGWPLTNHTDGGDGCKRRPASAETRLKLSKALRGRTFSPEWRARISASKRGTVTTAETRAKLAETSRGRKHTPEARALIAAANRQPKSEAARAAMSVAAKARVARDGYAVRKVG